MRWRGSIKGVSVETPVVFFGWEMGLGQKGFQDVEDPMADLPEINRVDPAGFFRHSFGVSQQLQPFGGDCVNVVADGPGFVGRAGVRIVNELVAMRIVGLGPFGQRDDDVGTELFFGTPDNDDQVLVVKLGRPVQRAEVAPVNFAQPGRAPELRWKLGLGRRRRRRLARRFHHGRGRLKRSAFRRPAHPWVVAP